MEQIEISDGGIPSIDNFNNVTARDISTYAFTAGRQESRFCIWNTVQTV